MTPEQFAYWLHGLTELTCGQTPDPAQWKAIREHLDRVFKKVTPGVENKVTVSVDTKDAQKAVEDLSEAMRQYRELLKPTQPWPFGTPSTIIC